MQRLFPWLALASYLVMIILNVLANALPLGGQDTAAVSRQFPNLFVPAGFTFAIWGVIYLLLGWWVVRQFMQAHVDAQQVAWWVCLSFLLNATWLLAWHYNQLGLSTLLIAFLLLATLIAYRGLDAGVQRLPFAVYTGWLCIATIANAAIWLRSAGWDGWGLPEIAWFGILVGIALLLGAFFLFRLRDPIPPLVFVWALIGLAFARQNQEPLSLPAAQIAWISAGFLSLGIVFFLAKFLRA
jgi:benzodiazapine receptor